MFDFTQIQHPDALIARTVTGTGTVINVAAAKGAIIQIDVSAASGTNPTLVIKAQASVDGLNWYDVDATNAVTASLVAAGAARIEIYPGLVESVGFANDVLPALMRLAWTIGGTGSPSFTFATHVALIP